MQTVGGDWFGADGWVDSMAWGPHIDLTLALGALHTDWTAGKVAAGGNWTTGQPRTDWTAETVRT